MVSLEAGEILTARSRNQRGSLVVRRRVLAEVSRRIWTILWLVKRVVLRSNVFKDEVLV